MKPLKESFIKAKDLDNIKSASLTSFNDLKFGDIVLIEEKHFDHNNFEDGKYTYIYLPKDIGENILRNEGSVDDVEDDIFINWASKRISDYNVTYWNATDFKVYFPFHQIYQSKCNITDVISHYANYKYIKNAKELKDILKKYYKKKN